MRIASKCMLRQAIFNLFDYIFLILKIFFRLLCYDKEQIENCCCRKVQNENRWAWTKIL